MSSEIIDVKGEFFVGDIILVCKEDGIKLVKVKLNYSSCLFNFIVN